MENTQVFLGLSIIILIGLIVAAGFKLKKGSKNKIPDLAIDEIRRVIWGKGNKMTKFRALNRVEAFKYFGLRSIPNAAYKDSYFVEVTTDEAEKKHLVRIVLAFDKEVIETEWK